jgi:hypothetical protein
VPRVSGRRAAAGAPLKILRRLRRQKLNGAPPPINKVDAPPPSKWHWRGPLVSVIFLAHCGIKDIKFLIRNERKQIAVQVASERINSFRGLRMCESKFDLLTVRFIRRLYVMNKRLY